MNFRLADKEKRVKRFKVLKKYITNKKPTKREREREREREILPALRCAVLLALFILVNYKMFCF